MLLHGEPAGALAEAGTDLDRSDPIGRAVSISAGMADAATQPPSLVRAMLEPSFYPHSPRSVELRDTHISWVFLAGDLAYKVKKPVIFPFLDYGTRERRYEMCREEVRLNRRLASEIYLGVVGIARQGDRFRLTGEDDPGAVEHAVEMRRVEEDRSLAALAKRGELDPSLVAAVADRLARFHAEARPAPPERQRAETLVATLDENLATLREAGEQVVGALRLDAAGHFTRSFVAARRAQLEVRARAGLVRECHGDLRAEHVIAPARGEVYVYDCVEFDPALRQIDVAADLAFLVMDLSALGAGSAAIVLVDAYRRAGGDPGDDALLSFLASYRAWVRAKIASLRTLEFADGTPGRRSEQAEAREFMQLGHRFAWSARGPVALVICGVAASGKTTLARWLADLSGWKHVSSDVTRKRIAGLAPTARAAETHYSREFTLRTYGELGRLARRELERGSGVIVDATCHRRGERAAFRAGLGADPAPLLFVECWASPQVLLARVRRRQLEPGRVSDAGAAVVRHQFAELEPLDDVPERARTKLMTDASVDELAAATEGFVDRALFAS
jgi:aminoglycoside phosphotransferase family enzyme/predicted kinase